MRWVHILILISEVICLIINQQLTIQMSFEVQHKIRQNAMEMREYMTDLYDWEQEMELKQVTKAKLKKEEIVRNVESNKINKQSQVRHNIQKQQKPRLQSQIQQVAVEIKKDLIRDVNTIGEYYKAWDKYDIDKELTKLQEEEQRAYKPYNPYQDSKNNLRAKPKTKIEVRGRRNFVNDPTQFKDKGNLHFQSLQFDKAINCYSECLRKLDEQKVPIEKMSEDKKKLRCVVLSNRAMSFLKIQETIKALDDASESLKYNPNYSKSYYRRAQCLKKLGKYQDSLKDFRMVRALEPGEGKAEAEIKKIEAFLAKRANQIREAMVLQYNPNLLIGSRRIEIDEITEFQPEDKVSQKNYLQEL